jgi:hypothetical protein
MEFDVQAALGVEGLEVSKGAFAGGRPEGPRRDRVAFGGEAERGRKL